MNLRFRPQEKHLPSMLKNHRLGFYETYNHVSRVKWYPVGWGFNKRVIGDQFGRLHYLACHAPKPVQAKWRAAYRTFMKRHFGDTGRASVRYLNKYSCHNWM